ncbi:MAG: bifunctional oligoribonuclease/PAP phosphatase NrnA [Chloroflexota bacterium]
MKEGFDDAGRIVASASCPAVVSHVRPDGDAVGSLLALTLSLRLLGKPVTPVLADGLPARYKFLPGAELLSRTLPEQADVIVAVDCSDAARLGLPSSVPPDRLAINIDHHATNTRFAGLNLVDVNAVATAEILYRWIIHQGFPLDRQVATNLLLGVVTDTIGFRTPNVTPQTLRLAAELVERGAPLAEVYDRGLNRRSSAAARYWGHGLQRLERDGGLVWTFLSAEDRRRSGYPGLDDADLINLLSAVDGAQVAVIFVEQPGGKVKVSWRSGANLDVARLAQEFGGGGHEPAAGAMIDGGLDEVVGRVLSATRSFLQPIMEANQ